MIIVQNHSKRKNFKVLIITLYRMANLDRYVQYLPTFSKVIKVRGRILRKILRAKKRNDAKILSPQGCSEKDIEAQLFLIGENHFFRSAEKQHKQSLRHILYKMLKSLNFFLDRESEVLAISSEIKGANAFVVNSFELMKAYAEEIEKLLRIYELQAVVVRDRNFKGYLKLCGEEETRRKELFSFSGNLFQLNTEIISFLKKNEASKDEGHKGMLVILSIYCGFGYLIMNYAILFAAPESWPPEAQQNITMMNLMIASIISIWMTISNRRKVATGVSRYLPKIKRLISSLSKDLTSN